MRVEVQPAFEGQSCSGAGQGGRVGEWGGLRKRIQRGFYGNWGPWGGPSFGAALTSTTEYLGSGGTSAKTGATRPTTSCCFATPGPTWVIIPTPLVERLCRRPGTGRGFWDEARPTQSRPGNHDGPCIRPTFESEIQSSFPSALKVGRQELIYGRRKDDRPVGNWTNGEEETFDGGQSCALRGVRGLLVGCICFHRPVSRLGRTISMRSDSQDWFLGGFYASTTEIDLNFVYYFPFHSLAGV